MLYVYILIAFLGWGIWGLIDKLAVTDNAHPVVIGLTYSIVSLCFDLTILTIFRSKISFAWDRGLMWAALGSIVSCIAMLTYTYALKEGEASMVVPLTGAYPLVTMLLAAVFLGESITLTRLFRGAFIVIGMLMVK